MKYFFMLAVAFGMSIISSLLTAFGMSELFSGVGKFILTMFVVIDLGRFLLFNFLVDEWNNLRKVKYFIAFILTLLFVYSGIGIFSKMSSLISPEIEQAMINITALTKAKDNANIKQERSEDLAKIAREEYNNSLNWNKMDYENCIKRANKNVVAENTCNNTKRRLDKTALTTLQAALSEADNKLIGIEETIQLDSKNKSEISTVLMTVCRISQKDCNTYEDLHFALSLIIFLIIIGTDYLQIAIVLAVNTRKNKIIKKNTATLENNVNKIQEKMSKQNTKSLKVDIETPKVDIEVLKTNIDANEKIKKIQEKQEVKIEKPNENLDKTLPIKTIPQVKKNTHKKFTFSF